MTRYAAGFWWATANTSVRAEYAHTGSSAAYTDKTTGKTRGKTNRCTPTSSQAKFKGKYMPVIRYDVFNVITQRNTYLPGSVGKQQDFLVGFLYMPIRG